MNKMIRMLCAGAVLAAVLTASAFAAEFTGCAARLEELGLFQGTDTGYELDRTPTRGEAAAMLVRLLGKESEAKALEYTAPFTDLSAWHKPYVQYLYENRLANGASASQFAPNEPCSAQMYAAFLLRALGYSEGAGDFAYADAVAAAQARGVYDVTVVDTADFRRDDVAAASYTALSLMPKGASRTLLDRLVADGAVGESAAAPYQALFAQYAAYRADTAGMDALERISIRSTYADGIAFVREETSAQAALTLSGTEQMTLDRAAGTMQAQGTLTVGAPQVQAATVFTVSTLNEGVLRRTLHGGAADDRPSAREQAQLLAAYAPVPIVYVEQAARSGASWTLSLDAMPAQYASLLWAAERTLGEASGAQYDAVRVTHRVSGGRITAQTLAAQLTQDGLHGEVRLTTEPEANG